MFCCKPIGVFDSGIGGVSVLKELVSLMPNEDFIYLADRDNAPYGEKCDSDILRFSQENVKRLLELDCKAIVIACNTATAVAAESLRKQFAVPIFGIEPAVKPAVMSGACKNVLVLTTTLTAEQRRFKELVNKYEGVNDNQLYITPVQELVTFVERGEPDSVQAISYLKMAFEKYHGIRFEACVLGCTHFSFAKETILRALGYDVEFFDGGTGTATNVKKTLTEKSMLSSRISKGKISWINVLKQQIKTYIT